MSGPLYSIVIPVYKSEKTLNELYQRISKAFAVIQAEYELILVEDCGGDNSWQVMQSIRRSDDRVKIIRLTKNFGQHNALMCGFTFACGQYVITMDDDLQNPPEEIEKLIDAIINSDHDVVYGVPAEQRQNLIRKLSSMIYARLNSRLFKKVDGLRISNFRIIRKAIVEQILKIKTPNPIVGHLILRVTEHIGAVTVVHHDRKSGNTTYSTSKLVRHFLHGVLYNTTLPLKMVLVMGVACVLMSMLAALYYLYSYLIGAITVSSFTASVLLIVFFSGIIMFSIGIIGEYLFRIIQEVNQPPQYVIKDAAV